MPWSRAALAVVLVGLARGIDAQERPPEPVTVTGQVVDATSGAPLEGAAIAVKGTTLRAFTDASGRFAFRTVPPGEHVWGIQRLGYDLGAAVHRGSLRPAPDRPDAEPRNVGEHHRDRRPPGSSP